MTKPTIELKKLKWGAAHSHQETLNFLCELWIDGKKIGTAENQGHGGCTHVRGDDAKAWVIINNADTYFKTLPKIKIDGLKSELSQDLEWIIDDMIDKAYNQREKDKFLKRMQKKMVNCIIVSNDNMTKCVEVKYPRPLSDYLKVANGKEILKKQILSLKKDYPTFTLTNEELKGLL